MARLVLLNSKGFFLSLWQSLKWLNLKCIPINFFYRLNLVFRLVRLHHNIADILEFFGALVATSILNFGDFFVEVGAGVHFCDCFAAVVHMAALQIYHTELTAVVVVQLLFLVDANVKLLRLREQAFLLLQQQVLGEVNCAALINDTVVLVLNAAILTQDTRLVARNEPEALEECEKLVRLHVLELDVDSGFGPDF